MRQPLGIFKMGLCFPFLLAVFSVHADTYFVEPPPAGNDGNDGSTGSPWATISHAVGAVSGGDVIEVRDGRYEEFVTVDKSITLQGATTPSPPTIAGAILGGPGAAGGQFQLTANNVTIDKFTFDEYGGWGISVTNSTSGHTIQNNYFYKRNQGVEFTDGTSGCTITDNTIDQSGECGLWIGGNGGHTIQGNTISNSADHCIDIRSSVNTTITINNSNTLTGSTNEGIMISGPATVDGNTITGNGDNGIWLEGGPTGVTVSNNTISSNSSHGIKIDGGAASVTVSGNTISSNTAGSGILSQAAVTIRGNTIQSNNIGVEIGHASVDIGQNSDAGAGMNVIKNNTTFNACNNTADAISAYRNHWGDENTATIDSKIWDDEESAGANGIVNFVPWLYSDMSLSVSLTSFSAHYSEKCIVVEWVTESEVNNLGYILERKTDNSDWMEIASYQTNDALKSPGNTSSRTEYEFVDENVEPGATYSYRLSDVDLNGKASIDDVISITLDALPEVTDLLPAFPNPFNPQTKIQYTLSEDTNVSLSVVDMMGRTVQTIIRGQNQIAGSYSVHWNGKDDSGRIASSGTYLLVLKAGDIHKTQKLSLIHI